MWKPWMLLAAFSVALSADVAGRMTAGTAVRALSPRQQLFLYPWTARNDARIPPMTELVDDGKWHDTDSQVAYNASASFLAYTLDLGGPDRLKQLRTVRSSDFAALPAALRQATRPGGPRVARLLRDLSLCDGDSPPFSPFGEWGSVPNPPNGENGGLSPSHQRPRHTFAERCLGDSLRRTQVHSGK